MRRTLHELLSSVIAAIVFVGSVMGFITIASLITQNESIIILVAIIAYMLVAFTIIRTNKKFSKVYKEVYNLTLDQAYIRNVLFDWSRGTTTTRSALQQIDQIYNHVYTDNIKIKDGDI